MRPSSPSLSDPGPRCGLLVLLFLAWMLPGLVGRDPWRADEAYSFGMVLNMVETGDWVVPTVAADPFMEKPPIFYITSAIFTQPLSAILPLHDAARAACVFYLALTLLFVGLTSIELNGRGTGWLAAVALLGFPGLIHTAHMLMTDNALLTGFALALYGLALGLRRPWLGGVFCGMGCGLAFLSKGLLGPGVIGLAVLALPCVSATWRSRNFLRLLAGIALGALPWLTIWPWLLYRRSPDLFMAWFWKNNIERFMGVGLGQSNTTPFHYVPSLIAFAFPAWVFIARGLWHEGRPALKSDPVRLPLLFALVTFLILSLAGQRRSNYALPLYAPLAVLAARYAAGLQEGTTRNLNRAIFVVFSLIALVIWFAWSAQFTGLPAAVNQRLQAEAPDYEPHLPGALLAAAAIAMLAWSLLWIHPRRESSSVMLHWTAGVALLYLLGMTLWLPFADHRNTERYVFQELRQALGEHPGPVSCRGLGSPQRALVHYFANVRPVSEEVRGPQDSDWLIVGGEDKPRERPEPPGNGWELAWEGHHGLEVFQLYRRQR